MFLYKFDLKFLEGYYEQYLNVQAFFVGKNLKYIINYS